MAIPTPAELIATHGCRTPEQLATALGFHIERQEAAPATPGVVVLSEYQPARTIVLYRLALREQARQQREPLARLEQWHVAHELYHGLAEAHGASAWRVRETEADLWAEELLALSPR